MNRIAICWTIAAAALAVSSISNAQATAPAEPSTAPVTVSLAEPTTAPVGVSVAEPTTAPARVSVAEPTTAPASFGADKAPPAVAGKYAGCIAWLNRAQREVNSIDGAKDPSQKDYLLGTLLTDYITIGDIPSAKAAFEGISTQQRLFWVGGLIAGMLVQGVDQAEAFRMLEAMSDKEIRKIIFRQLAAQLVGKEPLVGLEIVRKLPPDDQTQVLGEWVVNLVLAGKLVDARIASEGATSENMKQAVAVLDLAGRVAHGEKTFAQALAASGKDIVEFLPYIMSLDWEKVDKLDPNVAEGVLKSIPAGPARAGMEIGMAKNFIRQRKHKAAETFTNVMVADLRKVPVDKIPGPGYLEIAMVMAGVGRFDMAKTMFDRALYDRNQSVSIDRLLKFFETLIEADGGDMADRLAEQIPPGLLREQISRTWARFYIMHGQAGRVSALLAKATTPGERASLYIGVAAGLRDLADKAAAVKR